MAKYDAELRNVYNELEKLEDQHLILTGKIEELLKKKRDEPKQVVYTFGKYLKLILSKTGITQIYLAERSGGLTRPTISKIIRGDIKYYPQIRSIFISTLFIAAERDQWDLLYMLCYDQELFQKYVVDDYELSEEEKKKITQGIEDTWIPFGEYRIPKGLFELMMKV